MALPPIEIDVRADTAQAEAGLKGLQGDLAGVDKAAQRTGRGMAGAMAPVNRLGGSMRSTSMQTANLTAQFNDIGVMLAAGQSPLQLAMQQGTQITQVFNQMGGSGRDALRAIGGGLASMVNPMSLLTIGTIAAGAALFQWVRGAEKAATEAEILAERVDGAREALEGLRLEARQLRLGVSPEELAALDALAVAQEKVNQAARMASAPREETAAIGRAQLVTAQAELDVAQKLLEEIRKEQTAVETLKQKGDAVYGAFVEVGTAVDLVGTSLTTAIGLTGNLSDKALEAAGNIRSAMIEAYAIAATEGEQGRGGAGPGGPMGAADRFIASTGGTFAAAPQETPLGGGGGSIGQIDTTEAELKALEEQFMSETELLVANYEQKQELLQTAREKQLLTNKEYDELERKLAEEHANDLIDIDAWKHGDRLDQLQYGLKEAASKLAKGNAEMVDIGRKFAAIEATINAGRAFAQVASDPSLPWYAKIPAALGVASAISSFASQSGIGGGGGGGGGSSPAQQVEQAPSITQNRSLTLIGDNFNRKQAIDIAEYMNEGTDNGLIIRGRG